MPITEYVRVRHEVSRGQSTRTEPDRSGEIAALEEQMQLQVAAIKRREDEIQSLRMREQQMQLQVVAIKQSAQENQAEIQRLRMREQQQAAEVQRMQEQQQAAEAKHTNELERRAAAAQEELSAPQDAELKRLADETADAQMQLDPEALSWSKRKRAVGLDRDRDRDRAGEEEVVVFEDLKSAEYHALRRVAEAAGISKDKTTSWGPEEFRSRLAGIKKDRLSQFREAELAGKCPCFRACQRFVESNFPKLSKLSKVFDSDANICYCHDHCADRHPDLETRGGKKYGLPKGWCGLGLAIDSNRFRRNNIFDEWVVAFHGTKKKTAEVVLTSKWELLMPDEVTESGYKIPIRIGHFENKLERHNDFTGKKELFDPTQVFTSPSIKYCSYKNVYCDYTKFEGRDFQVAFQLRQKPNSYSIGQETVGAERSGDTIDPLFDNKELEYYTKRKGVHELYRLLIRMCPPP
eukprot:COSAG02_NODE_7712_length_2878_cov_26.479309_2_plen_464_part_00